MHKYKVFIKKKVYKKIEKLPEDIQVLLSELIEDLQAIGPIQKSWKNFSKIGTNQYHCHLKPSWVACWYWEKHTIEIEVYYVGSREHAPYA
jgi:mRNA-degrading endonuclease RelE of RelBE toxin-antitoxin system